VNLLLSVLSSSFHVYFSMTDGERTLPTKRLSLIKDLFAFLPPDKLHCETHHETSERTWEKTTEVNDNSHEEDGGGGDVNFSGWYVKIDRCESPIRIPPPSPDVEFLSPLEANDNWRSRLPDPYERLKLRRRPNSTPPTVPRRNQKNNKKKQDLLMKKSLSVDSGLSKLQYKKQQQLEQQEKTGTTTTTTTTTTTHFCSKNP